MTDFTHLRQLLGQQLQVLGEPLRSNADLVIHWLSKDMSLAPQNLQLFLAWHQRDSMANFSKNQRGQHGGSAGPGSLPESRLSRSRPRRLPGFTGAAFWGS